MHTVWRLMWQDMDHAVLDPASTFVRKMRKCARPLTWNATSGAEEYHIPRRHLWQGLAWAAYDLARTLKLKTAQMCQLFDLEFHKLSVCTCGAIRC
jgi:hypothetical protein